MEEIDKPGDLLRAYSERAKKWFGQHFLTDPAILGRIVECAGVEPGDHVLEVGPGCGTLTWQMLRSGARVTALEIDTDAVAFLCDQFTGEEQLQVVQADATTWNLAQLADDAPTLVVANLPYNVAIAILFRLLDGPLQFERLALMFQREVADRITAAAGSKAYGSLTLEIELRARARNAMRLKPGSFTPPPKVESAVVVFEPIDGTRIEDPVVRDRFSEVVTAAFATRRKTVRNALKARWPVEEVEAALSDANIDSRTRAERIDFEGFLRITQGLPSSPPEDDDN